MNRAIKFLSLGITAALLVVLFNQSNVAYYTTQQEVKKIWDAQNKGETYNPPYVGLPFSRSAIPGDIGAYANLFAMIGIFSLSAAMTIALFMVGGQSQKHEAKEVRA